MDYSILAAKITADHGGQTAEQIVAALNNRNIPGFVPTLTSDIKSYLVVMNKWLQIKDSTDNAARIAIDTLEIFDTLRVQVPSIRAVLVARLDDLIAGGFLTEDDKAYILGLGDVMQSWADINWDGAVKAWQVEEVL